MIVKKKILLTGYPGCGKTTLVRKVVERLERPAGGFYTREIREGGRRKGFEIVTLDGQRGVLAHRDIRSRRRVGRYGVDLSSLEALAVPAIERAVGEGGVVVIDEIGPMECFSEEFCRAVVAALESDAAVLATVIRRSTLFGDRVKGMPGVTLIEVGRENREAMAGHIVGLLHSCS